MVGTLRLHSLAQGGGAAPLLSRDGGFASLCLTTWRRRRSESIVRGKVPAAIRGGYNSEGKSSFSSVASIPIRGVHLRAAARRWTTFACKRERKLERETGFEPATSTLARSHSTTELFPLTQKLSSYHRAQLETM